MDYFFPCTLPSAKVSGEPNLNVIVSMISKSPKTKLTKKQFKKGKKNKYAFVLSFLHLEAINVNVGLFNTSYFYCFFFNVL